MNKTNPDTVLYDAFRKAQEEMEDALKSANNPDFDSDYADLKSIKDACFFALHAHGFAVTQLPTYDHEKGLVTVETKLLHTSGACMSGKLTLPVGKRSAQAVGSAITYARKYSLAAMAGVAPKDDDGNAASEAGPESTPKETKPPSKSPSESPAAEYKRLYREVKALIGEVMEHGGKALNEVCEDAGIVGGERASLATLRTARVALKAALEMPAADDPESNQDAGGEPEPEPEPERKPPNYSALRLEVNGLLLQVAEHSGRTQEELMGDVGIEKGKRPLKSALSAAKNTLLALLEMPGADESEGVQEEAAQQGSGENKPPF